MTQPNLAILRVVRPLAATAPRADSSEVEALFAQIATGEVGWQERAYLLFHSLVHRLLLKSLGANAEVEELVSDVFLSFFENAGRIRSASAVRSYLVSITMNRIRGEIRQRKRRSFINRLTGTGDEIARYPGTDDPKARAALMQLGRIVDELGPNERAAFVLRSMERMPILEIAEVLGVSESTAKRWARRANEHVRKKVSRNALLADYVQVRSSGSGDDGSGDDGAGDDGAGYGVF